MQWVKSSYLMGAIILGLLMGCETGESTEAVFNQVNEDTLEIGEIDLNRIEDYQGTIAVMEDADGNKMSTIYLGEGIFAFFHPDTNEFQGGRVNREQAVSLNTEDADQVEEYMLEMIEQLYGNESEQYQSLRDSLEN